MSRNVREITCDTRVMLRYALTVIVGAAIAAAVTACSAPAGQPATVTKSQPSSVVTSAPPKASGVTTDACRSLATDEGLAEFWRKLHNGEAVYGWDAQRASLAVLKLDLYASRPGVDPDVALTMSDSVDQMGDMNLEIAGGTAEFDVDRFKGIITPVVTVCEGVGVDMTVPE